MFQRNPASGSHRGWGTGDGGDENQSAVMTAWCNNIQSLCASYNLAVVIVHHEGKNTTGAGRGHSWLDTALWIESTNSLKQTKLLIRGRDTEQRGLSVTFNYPIWELTQQQVAVDASAVSQAGNFIIGALQLPVGNQLGVSDLRRDAMRTGHSDYAYKTALGEFIGRPHPKVVRG